MLDSSLVSFVLIAAYRMERIYLVCYIEVEEVGGRKEMKGLWRGTWHGCWG